MYDEAPGAEPSDSSQELPPWIASTMRVVAHGQGARPYREVSGRAAAGGLTFALLVAPYRNSSSLCRSSSASSVITFSDEAPIPGMLANCLNTACTRIVERDETKKADRVFESGRDRSEEAHAFWDCHHAPASLKEQVELLGNLAVLDEDQGLRPPSAGQEKGWMEECGEQHGPYAHRPCVLSSPSVALTCCVLATVSVSFLACFFSASIVLDSNLFLRLL